VPSSELTPKHFVFEALANDLRALGVETAFGLLSDDICQLVATLDALGVRFVAARHETNAVVMAAGYAAASGKLGVAIVGRGPAMANALHGIVSASRTGLPLLIISGEARVHGHANALGPDGKAFPAAAVLHANGVATFVATSAGLCRQLLFDAVQQASEGRTAVLLLPTDVQGKEIDALEAMDFPHMSRRPVLERARESSIQAATLLCRYAQRPLIVAGIGAFRAGARDAIIKLAERMGALLISSVKAKDIFRGVAYDLGILGSSSHSLARRFVERADCVIAFGASLNSFTMSSGAALPRAPLIHIDSMRGNIGRWWQADVAIVADARLAALQLIDAIAERSNMDKPFHAPEILAQLAAFKHTDDFEPLRSDGLMDQRLLALELDRFLPKERHIVFDSGNFMASWAYMSVPDPAHFTVTVDFGSVGLGLGTAIGVARGRPGCATILMIGDGGLLMSLGELETVVREDLAIVIVVMNDAAYGAEVHVLSSHGLPATTAKFLDVDFAAMAAPLGFQAYSVRTIDELKTLQPVLAEVSRPILLDCKVSHAVLAPFIAEYASRIAESRS
jgi:acetolactate synthase I/II/III large subunit